MYLVFLLHMNNMTCFAYFKPTYISLYMYVCITDMYEQCEINS